MVRFEYQSFLDVFPQYCQYLQQSIESGQKTLLGKIVGVYQVGFKNSTTGTGMRMEFLIMENLFYNKNVRHMSHTKVVLMGGRQKSWKIQNKIKFPCYTWNWGIKL